jgi:acetyl esterase
MPTRKFIRTVALLTAVCGPCICSPAVAGHNLCATAANTPATQPQPLDIEGATSYVYKSVNGVDLRLHVFDPTSTQSGSLNRPAVVFFFGGAWMIGNVTQLVPAARYFADRGIHTIVVDYRVFCRNGVSIVDEVADAKSAVRWIRSHAAKLGIDPERIVVSGGSSGGHLALSTAMFSELDEKTEDRSVSSRPNLLVLFYPCVDETTDEEKSYGGDAIGAHGKEVSPLYHVSWGLPRTIIFQGTADTLYAESRKYCDEVKGQGNHCEFVEYPGAPHGFFNPTVDGGKWYAQALRAMDGFLTDAGYLTASASSNARSPTVLFSSLLPDIPGKHLVVVSLTLQPKSTRAMVAHRHPGSVYVYVTKGTARLGIEGQPVQEVHEGQSFFEPAGALHTVAESASATEAATAIAVLIVPDGAPLVITEHQH